MPTSESSSPAPTASSDWVVQVCRLIEADSPALSLAQLAAQMQCSPGHLHRRFKAATGLTPKAFAAARRAERLRESLVAAPRVTDAIYEAGFGSSGRFYEHANQILGMTPSRYRAGGRDERLHFAVAQTALGALLAASSAKGVVAILLGDEPEALVRELQERFPRAELVGADPAYESHIAQIVGFVEAPRLGLGLPLDIRGTAFQQRVWQALQTIPAGQTVTYTQIAARIGQPSAVRAVASACAANPLAVAVPCHRVVRTDGSLSGYAWGVARKRALLVREAEATGAGLLASACQARG